MQKFAKLSHSQVLIMASYALSLINAPKTVANLDIAPYQENSSREKVRQEKRNPLAALPANHKAPINSAANITTAARSTTNNIERKKKNPSGEGSSSRAGSRKAGKSKEADSSSALHRIRRHLPRPSIKRRAGQYESSDEEDDPSILADLKSEQASLRSVLRVLEDDLEEKHTEIRNLSDDINRFRFRFNNKLRKVAENLGVGRLVENL